MSALIKIRAALETALAAMPGIIPSVGIATSSAGVFQTSAPHKLQPGVHVTIAGHTGVNGTYRTGDVPAEDKFTLEDIVTDAFVDSTGTGGSVAAELTAWENMDFPALANRVPYQEVYLMPAKPEDVTMGTGYRREYGIFQVTLVYPLQVGTRKAFERAELIRQTFPRGASFSNGDIVVHIDNTPEILRGWNEDDSYRVAVRVYYYANVFNN